MKDDRTEYSRRKFLGTTAAGLVTAGIAGLSPDLSFARETAKAKGKIIHRQLGKTGLNIPVISHGSGGCTDANVIQAAYEMGVRLFDTAANYQLGANEMLIGSVLRDMGVRDKAIILTKIYTSAQRRNEAPEKVGKKLETLLEGSLKRLRTDYVDVLMIQDVRTADDAGNPILMDGMKKLKEQGKARFIGISTHAGMTEVINSAAAAAENWDVILTTFNFTLANDAGLLSAIENAGKKDIGIIAMKTMAFGLQWPNPASRGKYDNPIISSALIKWVLNNKNVTTVMPACNNLDQLNEDFAVAYDLEFTAEEKKLLSDNNIELSQGFCRQCSKCLASCPNNADIPTLMRTHMYATRYRDFGLAQSALSEIEINRGLDKCQSCIACTAQCVSTVDIRNRISDLKSIYA